jgi:hypothetical protein
MSSSNALPYIDCGLCAAILEAKIKKATQPEPPPGSVPPHLVRDIDVTWDRWVNIELTVCFIDEQTIEQSMRERIIEYASYWTRPDAIASIKLKVVPFSKTCDIRIRVLPRKNPSTNKSNTNQSMIGTFSKSSQLYKDDPKAASMELAILDVKDGPNEHGINMFRRRVLHEFGHAFGFKHEQEREDFQKYLKLNDRFKHPISNTPATSSGKDAPAAAPAKTEVQILADKVANKNIIMSSVPDRLSIMMYPYAEKEMQDPKDWIQWNDNLSAVDKSFSNDIYPPVATATATA